MRERVLHALDLGMLGDWEGAKRSLEDLDDPLVPRLVTLMTEQQRREKERADAQSIARHELGNALSIAQANVEAMVDGVLEPTTDRLAGIREALHTCGLLLDDLKRYRRSRENYARSEIFNICDLIYSQVQLVSGIAESKNVRVAFERPQKDPDWCKNYRGDPDRIAHAVRHVLLSSVRYTPPGGTISIDSVQPGGDILLSVRHSGSNADAVGFSVVSKLLEAVGGARVVDERADGATLAISLPAVAQL
jgi:two-component system sensor histidine kinase BaeS